MSLEGAKLICLDEAGNHGEIVMAKGRKFTLGYYVNCDYVLVDERAKGVHCEIECDAFGRVTIRNLSPDKPILVNGSTVEVKRFLLNNSKLSILNKEYVWSFPKSSSNEFENIASEDASTPQKQIGIPEQPPNSCPDFKLHRELPKRFTIHNFAYCIQSDEEGNILSDTNNESTAEEVLSRAKEMSSEENKNSEEKNQNTTENREVEDTGQKRSITPEPKKESENSTSTLLETPKMNLINCTNDKENKSTQKKNKQLLTMCHLSDVVITSFSPRETGVRIEKSFATIIKPKVLVTKPPTTPKSVYSTPKGEMKEIAEDSSRNLISFQTPSTSKTGAVSAFSSSTAAKVLKNSSMHLIDLTTPNKLRPASPYLKTALKAASIKKNFTQSVHSELISEEAINVSELPSTPAINETPSSIISVSSIDTPSVIEVTSDASNMGITPVSGLTTPKHLISKNTGVSTPKRTPQSLMKRALLTSAKKQTTTSQTNTVTPRRDSLNRIPLRSALLRTPITPQNATADKSTSQQSRRLSMSTPTRKSASTRNMLDNSPSTSKTAIASSRSTTRRPALNPISALRGVPTSTPMTVSSNNAGLRTRAACKTSPLHKIRKSVSGIPLSSHISKSRRTIVLPASTSKLTSSKDKSPQQIMSNRLVNRARKSLGISPISTRTNTPAARKTIKPRKPVLFDDKHSVDRGKEDDLSRTYVIDSDDDDNVKDKTEKDKPNDATFSPVKDNTINLINITQQGALEIPLDVEELSNISKNQNPSSEQNVIDDRDIEKLLDQDIVQADVFKDIPDDALDKGKPLVAEESFAEIINLTPLGHPEKAIEIFNSPEESSRTESKESFAETIDVEQHTVTTTEESTESSIENNIKKTEEILGSGFGEESISALAKETSKMENIEELVITKGDIESIYLYANEISNKDNVQDKSLFENLEIQNETAQIDDLIVESTIDVTELATKSNIQDQALLQENTIENENSNKSENSGEAKAEAETESLQIEGIMRTESETIGDEPSICDIESVNNDILSETVEEINEKEISHHAESITENVTESIEENLAISDDKSIHKNDDTDNTSHQKISESIGEPEALDTVSSDNDTCLNATVEDNEKVNTCKTESKPMNESKIGETVCTENKDVVEDSEKSETLSATMSKSVNASSECDIESANNVPLEVIIENIEEGNTPQSEIVSVCTPIVASEELYGESTDNEIDADDKVENNAEKNASQNEIFSSPKSMSEPKICETESNKIKFTLEVAVADKETTNTSQIVPETDTEMLNEVRRCKILDNNGEPNTSISLAMLEDTDKEDTQQIGPDVTVENNVKGNTRQNKPEDCEIESSKSEFTSVALAEDENITIADNNDETTLSIPQVMVEDIGKESSSQIVPPVQQNVPELIINESEITEDEKNTSFIINNKGEESKDEHSIFEKDEIAPKTALTTENNEKENRKSFEYKPIYEDITLESSLIEKELAEEGDNAESKQPIYEDITMEGSAIKIHVENEVLENKSINDDKTLASTIQEIGLEINERSNETVALEIYQTEADDNFENTTKLLEEIEDVLNKSDEIKQKHLNELEVTQEESGDNKPLTEEYENFTQETSLSYSSAGVEKTASDNEIEIKKDLIVTENVDSPLNNAVREVSNETESEANKIETQCPQSESKNLDVESLNFDDRQTKETLTNQYSWIETEINEESIKPSDIRDTKSKHSESDVKEENTEFRKEVPENNIVKQNIALEETNINSNIEEVSNEKKHGIAMDSTILLRANPMQIKMDNTTCLTPKRRSTRRASQSSDLPQTSTEASFTPRRSTRGASMPAEITIVSTPTRKSTRRPSISAETTTVSTPTRKSTRRASLSAINETTSVSQIITRRRASMSVEEEINKPAVTCKTPRAKTPQKQIKQKMIIPEELDEVITSTILEEDDENVIVERVSLGEIITKEVGEIKAEVIPIVEEGVSTTEKLQLQEEPADDIDADSESFINKQQAQTKSENMESITHEVPGRIEKSEVETVKEALTIENMSKDEKIEKKEIKEDSSTCPLKQVISSTTDNLSSGDTKETQLSLAGIESSLTENVDVSNTAAVQKDKLMETAAENPNTPNEIQESHVNEGDQSSSITSVTTAEQELMKSPMATGNEGNDNGSVENEKEISFSHSLKTQSVAGERELLKTPKLDVKTPKLGGIRDLVRTPTQNRECEKEETENFTATAQLVQTPAIRVIECEEKADSSLIWKNVENIDSSPKTPLMKGMRELLKTPKPVIDSPNLTGLQNLVQTPKAMSENKQKEIENPAPQTIGLNPENVLDVTPITSNKAVNLQKVKELLKPSKICSTPHLKGMRELMQTPKFCSTPQMEGMKELMDVSSVEVENKIEDSIESERTKNLEVDIQEMSLKGIKELLKTPKTTDTPRLKGMRELLKTPKICSTPLLTGVKELLDSSVQEIMENVSQISYVNQIGDIESVNNPEAIEIEENVAGTSKKTPKVSATPLLAAIKKSDEEFDKFLKTPTAKNIMIPTMPSSAVIEKSADSIEVSTEYDLNATNEGQTSHLGDIFKTPAGSHFAEHITASYYDEERDAEKLGENISSTNKNETLQDCLNKSAEEAFDKLVGQENQIQTPVRNTYNRKSTFDLKSQQAQSPFTVADVLSDLPKTDVEEWIETLGDAEPPIILECEDSESTEAKLSNVFNSDQDKLETTDNECIIPETCTKVYLSETNRDDTSTYALINDPLRSTPAKVKEKETYSITSIEAEISGINLLDQTVESIQNDSLLLIDDPSMFEEPLLVSDNESEPNDIINNNHDGNEVNKKEADTSSQIVLEFSEDDEDNDTTHHFNLELSQESASDTFNNAHDGKNVNVTTAQATAQSILEFLEEEDCNDLSEPLLLSDSEDLNNSQELEKCTKMAAPTNDNTTEEYQQTINTESLQERSILETGVSFNVTTSDDPLKHVSSTIVIANDDNVEEEANITERTTVDDENQVKLDSVEENRIEGNISPINQNISSAITLEVKGDILEKESIQEIGVYETQKPTILTKEFIEVSIEETNVKSQKSDNIFIDTSVIEIFEETTPTEQQIVIKEDIKSAELPESSKKDQECENIFMDSCATENSQIDESFADEATTREEFDVEETVAAMGDVTIVDDITNAESVLSAHSVSVKYSEQTTNSTEVEENKNSDNNVSNADIESVKDIPTNETETNIQFGNIDNHKDDVKNDEIQLNFSSDEKSEDAETTEKMIDNSKKISDSSLIENVKRYEQQSSKENAASEENIVPEELVTEVYTKNSSIAEEEILIAPANEEIVIPTTDKREVDGQDNNSYAIEVAPSEDDNEELENTLPGDDEKVEIMLLAETTSKNNDNIVEKEVLINIKNTAIESVNKSLIEIDESESIGKVKENEEVQNTQPSMPTANVEVSTVENEEKVEIKLLLESASKEGDNIVEKEVLMNTKDTTIESINKSVTESDKSESIEKVKEKSFTAVSTFATFATSAEISLKEQPERSNLQSSEEHSKLLENKIDDNSVSKIPTKDLADNAPLSSLSIQVAKIKSSEDSIEVKEIAKVICDIENSSLDNAASVAPEESKGKNFSTLDIVHKQTMSSEGLTPISPAIQYNSEMVQESTDKIFVAAEVVKSYNFEVKIKDLDTAKSSKDVLEVHTITNLIKGSNRTEEQSGEKSKEDTDTFASISTWSSEHDEIVKAKENKTDDKKVDVEHNEINETKLIRSSLRKRSDSDSSQGSIYEGITYGTRRDRRKIIKKPTEPNLLEEGNQVEESLEKDTQSDHLKEVVKRTRKRTTSDSSQGSVKGEESSISTRRTRRKVQKAPVEVTVMEQKEEELEVNVTAAEYSAIASSEQFENQKEKLLSMQEADTSRHKQTTIAQESEEDQGTSKIMEKYASKQIENVEQLSSDILVSLETLEDDKNLSLIEELSAINTPIPEKFEEQTDRSTDNVEMLPSDIQVSSEIAEDNKKSSMIEDQFAPNTAKVEQSEKTTDKSSDNIEIFSSDYLDSSKSFDKQSLAIEGQFNSNEILASSESDDKQFSVIEEQSTSNAAEQSDEKSSKSADSSEINMKLNKDVQQINESIISEPNTINVTKNVTYNRASSQEFIATAVLLEQEIEQEQVIVTQNLSPLKDEKESEQESSSNILTEQQEEELSTETFEKANITEDIYKSTFPETNLSSVNVDNSKIHTRRGREKLQTAALTEKINEKEAHSRSEVAISYTNVKSADFIDLTECESTVIAQESQHDTKTAVSDILTDQSPEDIKFKDQAVNRINRKLSATVSSQVPIHEEDISRSKRTYRKVQKTPIEEDKTEENLQKVYLTSTNNEASVGSEISLTIQTITPEQQEEKVVKVKPVKRSRRKPTVSESSQGSVHDDDNASHSRRIRRKVQKTPIETVVIEEHDEKLASKLTTDHDTKSELSVETTETSNEIKLPHEENVVIIDTESTDEINKIITENLATAEVLKTESPKQAVIQEQWPVNEKQSTQNEMVVNEENLTENEKSDNSKYKHSTTGEELNSVSAKRSRRKVLPFPEELSCTRRKGRRKVQEMSPETIHDKYNLSVAHHNLPETSALPEEPSTSHKNRREVHEISVEKTNMEKLKNCLSITASEIDPISAERKDIILPPNETNDFKTHDFSFQEQHLQKKIVNEDKQIPQRVGRRPRVNTPQIIETKDTVICEENVHEDNDELKYNSKGASTESHKELPATKTPELESIAIASSDEYVTKGIEKSEEVGISQEEDTSTDYRNEQEHKKKSRPAKKNVKRTRTASETSQDSVVNRETIKRQVRHLEEINKKLEEANVQIEKKLDAKADENSDNLDEIAARKDIEEKPQKPTRRRAVATHKVSDEDYIETGRSRRRRGKHEDSDDHHDTDTTDELKELSLDMLSKVQITEANLKPEQSPDTHTADEKPSDIKTRRVRKKIEDDDLELLPLRKRRAAIRNADLEHDNVGTSKKRRVGRRKLAAEESKIDEGSIPTQNNGNVTEQSDISRKETINEPKEHEIIEEHETEQHSSDNLEKNVVVDSQNEQIEKPDIVENVKDESKKSRFKKKETHQQDDVEQQSTSHLAESKPRGRKDKETYLTSEETSLEKVDAFSTDTEPLTPQRTGTGAVSRGVRKASAKDKEHHEHITAESNENDDTPGRRARNVPQRKAATAYHNYDETSDSEIPTKIKKKTDSPRKSLEVTKSSPPATITAAPVIISSPSLLASGPTTTARGRTRKPTARVQQFLEEERAKAETPKKRALLAAAVAVDASTPQRTPAKRGRKPSNLNTETEGTPQPTKGRGRGRPPINTSINKEENTKGDTTPVVEESEGIGAHANSTPIASTVVKAPRRVGRKAKLTEDDRNKKEEPPGKKSPVELKSDKSDSSPAIDAPTPTRTTGKRNAAAAAKARIEEDALAAAALDPPKRGRTKKAPKIVVTTTTTNEFSSETKTLSQKGEEHLNLSSSMLGSDKDDVGVVEGNVEKETLENPIHKRIARKIAATSATDSPVLPSKRGRKPKVVEDVNEPETPDDAKVVRGRGRRKVQQSTETSISAQANIIATEPESVEKATEPVKRGTRTRRK
ncbi:hypothetical protein DOY81_003083 [Sarcophaga bullata]|nr:hypothetical protein DOY81_003083 [Sarcophaga bullata]